VIDAGDDEFTALAKHPHFKKNLRDAVLQRDVKLRYGTNKPALDKAIMEKVIEGCELAGIPTKLWPNILLTILRENFGRKGRTRYTKRSLAHKNQMNVNIVRLYKEARLGYRRKLIRANKWLYLYSEKHAKLYQTVIDDKKYGDSPLFLAIAIRGYLAYVSTQLWNVMFGGGRTSQKAARWRAMTPAQRAGILFFAGTGDTGISGIRIARQALFQPNRAIRYGKSWFGHHIAIRRAILKIKAYIKARQQKP
jgi:hypothetical protein